MIPSVAESGRRVAAVVLEFDGVAVRITHVEAPSVPSRSPDPGWPGHDVELARGRHGMKIDIVGNPHRDMIDVLPGRLADEQIDHRAFVDPDREEGRRRLATRPRSVGRPSRSR